MLAEVASALAFPAVIQVLRDVSHFSMTYPEIGIPPVATGTSHVKVTESVSTSEQTRLRTTDGRSKNKYNHNHVIIR